MTSVWICYQNLFEYDSPVRNSMWNFFKANLLFLFSETFLLEKKLAILFLLVTTMWSVKFLFSFLMTLTGTSCQTTDRNIIPVWYERWYEKVFVSTIHGSPKWWFLNGVCFLVVCFVDFINHGARRTLSSKIDRYSVLPKFRFTFVDWSLDQSDCGMRIK